MNAPNTKLYETIALASKFGNRKEALVESLPSQEPSKTTLAMGVAKHLAEAKQPEAKPVSLNAFPVSN